MLGKKPVCFLIGFVSLPFCHACGTEQQKQPQSHFVPEFNHNSFDEQPREAEM